MFSFHRRYVFFAVGLFLAEVCIALFVNDRFIRPYVGDFLVVMLMYCAVKAVFDVPHLPTAIGVLLFAYLIEFLQYLNIVSALGLLQNKLATTVLGSSFAWLDMLAYTLGVATILLLEW
jgi:hypothetical protein